MYKKALSFEEIKNFAILLKKISTAEKQVKNHSKT